MYETPEVEKMDSKTGPIPVVVFLKTVFANVSNDERYIGGYDDIAIGVDGHLVKLHLQLGESDQVVDGVAPLKHEVASIAWIVSKVVDRVDQPTVLII